MPDEYLERLEGKIRKCLFFYVKIFWNNSVMIVDWYIHKLDSLDHMTYKQDRVIYIFVHDFLMKINESRRLGMRWLILRKYC